MAEKAVKAVINSRIRLQVWQAYTSARPKEGAPYYAWVEQTAEDLGISETQVQRVVADESGAMALAMRQQTQSIGQQVADLMGATVQEAFAVMHDAMRATEKKFFRDRQGKPIMDETTNEPMFVEIPLHEIRVRAGKEILKVHGAYAPQQYEVNKKVLYADLSDLELLNVVTGLRSSLEIELAGAVAQTGSGEPGTADTACIEGQVLLADGMHSDGGRAGSGEPE